MDSLIAMLPSGHEKLVENDSAIGEAIRDDLNKMLAAVPKAAIMLVTHAKKPISDYSIPELKLSAMQNIVR